jgi:ribonuclease VapC
MIVLDTSAIIAILLDEDEAGAFSRVIETADGVSASAASVIEAAMVLIGRVGVDGRSDLVEFIRTSRCEIVPVTADQVEIAIDAFVRYGKGNHKAGLNFGDCFADALARSSHQPLLYKGGDFALTDIAAVAY